MGTATIPKPSGPPPHHRAADEQRASRPTAVHVAWASSHWLPLTRWNPTPAGSSRSDTGPVGLTVMGHGPPSSDGRSRGRRSDAGTAPVQVPWQRSYVA